MVGFGPEILVLLLSMGGGGNELLDFLPTDAYWKTKGVAVSVERLTEELRLADPAAVAPLIRDLGAERHETREEATRKLIALGPAAERGLRKAAESDDPEVRSRAKEILGAIYGVGEQAKMVRRLMAVRTLGELKKPEALPALRPLLESKEPFVADYARRAIAALEAKPCEPPRVTKEARWADLCLLPPNCGFVGQFAAAPGGPAAFEKAIKTIKEALPKTPDVPDPDRMLDELAKGVCAAAEGVGNARLDLVTIGLSDDMGDDGDKGSIVIVARGLYNAEAVAAILKGEGAASEVIDGIPVYHREFEGAFIPSSRDRLVIVFGPNNEHLPIKEVVAGIKANRDEPALNAEMLRLVRGIDTAAPLWGAIRVTPAYREAPILAPFETVVFTSQQAQDGALALRLVARGKDAAAIKAATDELEKGLKEAKEEVKREITQIPALKPIPELLESIRIENDGQRVTITGTAKQMPQTLLIPFLIFLPMGFDGFGELMDAPEPPAEAVE